MEGSVVWCCVVLCCIALFCVCVCVLLACGRACDVRACASVSSRVRLLWTKQSEGCRKFWDEIGHQLQENPSRWAWKGELKAPTPIATLVKAVYFGCKITWLTSSRVENRIRQRKTTQKGWTIHASSIHLHTSRMQEKVPICCFISKLHLSPNWALPMRIQCFWKSMAWPRTPLSLCLSRPKCNVAFFPQR